MSDELSPSQVATRIGTTTRSVQRWIKDGRLPARRVGGRWRVASDALDAFVAPTDQWGDRPGSALGRTHGPAVRVRPVGRLLVANRGEIARRIVRTAERLGVATIVPAIDGPHAIDLLDVDAVVAAARASGADAVHPGYGFLAESPDLAEAVAAAGVTWVGPPASAIRSLGDKARARAIARSVGVPVAAGEEPDDQSDAALSAAAARIGFPILVKPVAGGGGKGIRVVEDQARVVEALAGARREARRAFGDERLLLERYLVHARHVEVQVLADGQGGVVHLGDRDCSLQRRHQKLLEEAPAPGLDRTLRASLRDAATRLAAAVGYRNAGTCEFLVAEDGSFVFLEMNARLQVEHPVTELVIGRDLVEDQLRLAGGATLGELGLEQRSIEAALEAGGHAIEVRLNAEDPEAGFLPASGRILAARWPADSVHFGPVGRTGIRVDAGIDVGDPVGGRFDPLLAKVIAHAPTREAALDRLARALEQTEVLGLATNLRFLRRLMHEPVVRDAALRIDTLDGDPAASPISRSMTAVELPTTAWSTAAALLAETGSGRSRPRDPWSGGWRTNLPRRISVAVEATGRPERRSVDLPADRGLDEQPGAAGRRPTGSAPDEERPLVVVDGDTVHASVEGRSVAFRLADPPDPADADGLPGRRGAEPSDRLTAPMPGTVLAVHATAGEQIDAGARIATLEAMKMEHEVIAARSGRIATIDVRPGDQVERGQRIAMLEETT